MFGLRKKTPPPAVQTPAQTIEEYIRDINNQTMNILKCEEYTSRLQGLFSDMDKMPSIIPHKENESPSALQQRN